MRTSLEDGARKQCTPRHSPISARETYLEPNLGRIIGPDESITHPATEKQIDTGNRV